MSGNKFGNYFGENMTTFKNCTNCAHRKSEWFGEGFCLRVGQYCMDVMDRENRCIQGRELTFWTPKPPTWKEIAIAFMNKRAVKDSK